MSTKQLEAAVENALDDLFAARDALESRLVRFDVEEAGREVLERIPDGWAKVDGQWIQLTLLGRHMGEHSLQEVDGPLWTSFDYEVTP